jgi:hypothetical protein
MAWLTSRNPMTMPIQPTVKGTMTAGPMLVMTALAQ